MKQTKDEVVFRAGLCTGIACAPKGMKRAAVEEACNRRSPTGIASRWQISRKRKLDNGTKLPAPCLEDKGRVHYLLEC